MLCSFNGVEFKENSGRFIMADGNYFLVMGLDRDNYPIGICSFDIVDLIGDCMRKYSIEKKKRIEIAGLSFFVENETLKYPDEFLGEMGGGLLVKIEKELNPVIESLFGGWDIMFRKLHKILHETYK